MSRVGLFVTPLGSLGGVYRWIVETSRILEDLGCEVKILVFAQDVDRVSSALPQATVVQANRYRPFRSVTCLRRWVQREEVDTIVTALPQALLLALIALGRRVPWIATLHGSPPCRLRGAVYRQAVRVAIRMRVPIAAVSYSTKSAWDLRTSIVIPNSVPVPAEAAADASRTGILFVGRLEPEKGIDWLVSLIKSNPHLSFTIAGDGTARSQIEFLCETSPNATYIGWVSETGSLMRRHKFYLNTSPSEGMPYALLDALACGLQPLIRSRELVSELGLSPQNTLAHTRDLDRCIVHNSSVDPTWLLNKYRRLAYQRWQTVSLVESRTATIPGVKETAHVRKTHGSLSKSLRKNLRRRISTTTHRDGFRGL